MKFKSTTRILIPVEVIQIRDVTPAMRRITVAGDGLHTLVVDKPTQWMKVFFPTNNAMPPTGRAYTIRRFNAADGRMDLDFVLHGDNGPASYWVARAKPGEILSLAGPRSGYDINPSAHRHILIGDATALPAMASIVAVLPPNVQVEMFVEVSDKWEEQVLDSAAQLKTHWLHAGKQPPGTTGQLEQAIKRASFDASDCQYWVGGESSMVRAVLSHLVVERLIPRAMIHSAGYWKLGATDHRE
ncbi:siderophore-interacting protein [Solimicrobium silvestre]|uniref:Siderophore-interacting protein n=1 Tax=Solimicrobium silvestre TaxID=2099400 RepID=A0A2S9H2A4_9BURK|nr:siderophore-interacting protein [Solimicrobium silvestre]PRC94087.1 Siderophore-interacting protein [Solimicrobium silvestre]